MRRHVYDERQSADSQLQRLLRLHGLLTQLKNAAHSAPGGALQAAPLVLALRVEDSS